MTCHGGCCLDSHETGKGTDVVSQSLVPRVRQLPDKRHWVWHTCPVRPQSPRSYPLTPIPTVSSHGHTGVLWHSCWTWGLGTFVPPPPHQPFAALTCLPPAQPWEGSAELSRSWAGVEMALFHSRNENRLSKKESLPVSKDGRIGSSADLEGKCIQAWTVAWRELGSCHQEEEAWLSRAEYQVLRDAFSGWLWKQNEHLCLAWSSWPWPAGLWGGNSWRWSTGKREFPPSFPNDSWRRWR